LLIEFSPRSQADLFHIRDYIADDSPAAAERTIARLLQSIRYLERFPEIGRQWRGGPTRALSVPGLPYRVHYQINGDVVEILTVVHTSRKLNL
jgi:addiction module RelE/StbE family toxin